MSVLVVESARRDALSDARMMSSGDLKVAAAEGARRTPSLVLTWDGRHATARGAPRHTFGESPAGGLERGTPFARWAWDGTRLEVRTDRLGCFPLFYAVDGSTLWLSSSIPELLRLGAPAALDDAALAVFLRLGTFLAEDTPFLHVRALPPDARLTWSAGRLQVAGRRVERPRLEIGREAAIARYAELFRAAMAKHPVAPERTLVPLSGGRDSRHILLELHATGRVPGECVTVRPAPPTSDDDVTVAAALARAVGVRHTVLETTDDRLGDEIEKNLRTSLCALEHFWVMPLVRHVAARRAAGQEVVIYDGIGGDTLSQAKYLTAHRLELFRKRRLARYAEEELRPEAYLPVLLQKDVYRRFSRALAVERLKRELRTHVDAPNPVSSYRFWNRTRRTVAPAPFGLLASAATVRAPFLDADLYDFLASLPAKLVLDRALHTDTIVRSYPQFASMPYERELAPPKPVTRHARRFGLAALGTQLRHGLRARGAASETPLLRHGAYTARLAALLVAPRRAHNAGSIAEIGVYLSQIERIARRD
jgi:asparagine synthetase B (glutamine-hydrolysing)